MSPIELLKRLAFRYTSLGMPSYRFNVEPIQLATLVCEIDRLKDTAGAIVEIGVARGLTTRFLCEHLERNRYTDQKLYAIDTFHSFPHADVDYEVARRGKKRRDLKGVVNNDVAVWKRNFRAFPFVHPIQSDCSIFDYSTISPIKLVFLDVDLYLPIKRVLPKLYENLCDGGVILVDDVLNNHIYDGAYQAYMEFCADLNMSPAFVGNKCGIIRK